MQRTRTRGGIEAYAGNLTLSYFGSYPDNVSSLGGSDLFAHGRYEEFTDIVSPNFKRVQASGGVVNSPMSRKVISQTGSASPTSSTWVGSPIDGNVRSVVYDYMTPAVLSLPSLSSVDLESLKREAYTKAVAGVNAPDILGLVDIVEAKKTISSLAGLAKQFGSIVKGIRSSSQYLLYLRSRSLRDTWANLQDHIALEWLRYRYFFIPLMLSSVGVLKALDTKTPRPERKTSRASVDVSASASHTYSSAGAPNWSLSTFVERSVNVRVRSGLLYDIRRGKCLTANLGLELQHVPSAIWELIPFSFVADWFFNIGDVVSAVTPDAGVSTLCSWTTVVIEETTKWQSTSVWAAGDGYPITRTPGSTSGERVTLSTDRTPGGSVGLVTRAFQGKWVDLIHLADAVALLRQLLK